MNSFTSFFSSLGKTLNPVRGSFSGAMDVIVISSPEGKLSATSFQVKFGRFKSFMSKENTIEVIVNGSDTGIIMELAGTGKGIFSREKGALAKCNEEISGRSNYESQHLQPPRDNFLHNPQENAPDSLSIPISPEITTLNMESSLPAPSMAIEIKENTLSSEELQLLKLKPGINIIHYQLISKKQIVLSAKIYLWDYRSKLIISDIDGTVTKSDILGHLFYIIKKD